MALAYLTNPFQLGSSGPETRICRGNVHQQSRCEAIAQGRSSGQRENAKRSLTRPAKRKITPAIIRACSLSGLRTKELPFSPN